MLNAHKIEIYNRTFNFKDMCAYEHNSVEVNTDYLTLSSNTLTVPKLLKAQNGDYIYSTSGIQGIVDSVEYSKGQTEVTYKPMHSLFDVDVYYKSSALSSSLVGFFEGMIKNTFINNEDSTQNIEGLTVECYTENDVKNATLNIVDNINNIFTLLQKALKKYRLYLDIDLQPYEKKIVARLKINDKTRYIIAEKPYVVDSEIYIKPSNKGINKLIGYWQGHEDDSASPYIVKKDDEQTFSKSTTKYYYGEDADEFRENVKNDSYELFSYDETSNFISVTINSNSYLYSGYGIGDLGVIIYDNIRYTAILTQITTGKGLTEYVFGDIRLNLTDKLLLGGL